MCVSSLFSVLVVPVSFSESAFNRLVKAVMILYIRNGQTRSWRATVLQSLAPDKTHLPVAFK